ncbi:DUF262 domain-containing protein [Corynebacterium durum]|uniref:DUF262 domain-containing protein n=1 Tax=Corynebacterium durum TaxID=61592 RepID=UPI0026DB854E|nr:DUF262 domain-containing protein [Corynebacterium durum]MDO4652563.1 DUF262 domain-containing protein [Corynebacterium durum]
MSEISINQMKMMVLKGEIRIPAFQRGFVWDDERIVYLIDSLYKGYPVGSIILWKTREQLKQERKLGPFKLPEPEEGYPIHYVLDGQQRITTIYGTFADQENGDSSWPRVYFDMQHPADAQGSFFTTVEDEVDFQRYFPVDTFFNTVAYRKATDNLSDNQKEQIDKVQERFKDLRITTEVIATENRSEVAIVFERVNRLGMELDQLQLLSAWTWNEDFDLLQQFEDFSDQLDEYNFNEIAEDTTQILRCISALIAESSDSSRIMNYSGDVIRDYFPEMRNGLKGAIDFVKNNLDVHGYDYLPYRSLLVPLCVFFARRDDEKQVRVSDFQREKIVRWFWRSLFTRRYSAGTRRNIDTDISEMKKLREYSNSDLGEFKSNIDAEFFKNSFSKNAVNTKIFLLLLINARPMSFISGEPVSFDKKLSEINRVQFHHLFPKAFLKKKKQEGLIFNENLLVNYAIISSGDNKELGGDAPSVYKDKMPQGKINQILDSALCPDSLFDDDYRDFIEERADLLALEAKRLMEI